jgi:hypothetical protein
MICTLHCILLVEEECSTPRRGEKYKISVGNPARRDHLGNLSLGDSVIENGS